MWETGWGGREQGTGWTNSNTEHSQKGSGAGIPSVNTQQHVVVWRAHCLLVVTTRPPPSIVQALYAFTYLPGGTTAFSAAGS